MLLSELSKTLISMLSLLSTVYIDRVEIIPDITDSTDNFKIFVNSTRRWFRPIETSAPLMLSLIDINTVGTIGNNTDSTEIYRRQSL